jgi:FixJ family two-component response regulator
MGILAGNQIAFVDDEFAVTKPYRDRCAAEGATVQAFDYVSDMLEFVMSGGLKSKKINALVVDLQMPKPDKALDADFIAAGSLSGLWLLGQIAAEIIENKVAVIVLTNVGEEHFKPYIEQLGYPPSLLVAHRKINLSAMKLPQVIAERIQVARR